MSQDPCNQGLRLHLLVVNARAGLGREGLSFGIATEGRDQSIQSEKLSGTYLLTFVTHILCTLILLLLIESR